MSYRTYKFLLLVIVLLVAAGTVGLAVSAVIDALGAERAPAPAIETASVKIYSPRPGEFVKSPLIITGEARAWYFEGSFPVELNDGKGRVLATGQAIAQSAWMTDQFVPFVAKLEFSEPTAVSGTIVLKKDNPSGLPANDEQISLPVRFDPAE